MIQTSTDELLLHQEDDIAALEYFLSDIIDITTPHLTSSSTLRDSIRRKSCDLSKLELPGFEVLDQGDLLISNMTSPSYSTESLV